MTGWQARPHARGSRLNGSARARAGLGAGAAHQPSTWSGKRRCQPRRCASDRGRSFVACRPRSGTSARAWRAGRPPRSSPGRCPGARRCSGPGWRPTPIAAEPSTKSIIEARAGNTGRGRSQENPCPGRTSPEPTRRPAKLDESSDFTDVRHHSPAGKRPRPKRTVPKAGGSTSRARAPFPRHPLATDTLATRLTSRPTDQRGRENLGFPNHSAQCRRRDSNSQTLAGGGF